MRAFFLLITFYLAFNSLFGQINQKHRVIILTDIEADSDDTQSLVRLLLYSNEIDIKGIVATTSCWHKTMVNPESITKVMKAYAEVQPNLIRHDLNFPEAKTLFPLVKQGLPKYGMLGVGEGNDSEGADLIIKELEEDGAHRYLLRIETSNQQLYRKLHPKIIRMLTGWNA